MPGEESKVQYGISRLHYAVMLTEGEKPTWDTPKPIPGGISLALSAQGNLTKFYADDITYWQEDNNNGYEGDLEVARIPDSFLTDVFGWTETPTDKVLIENAFAKAKHFALLFRVNGDKGDRLAVVYNCVATRPNVGGQTVGETREPQTQTVTINVSPLADGRVKAATKDDSPQSVFENWFKKVYEPAGA